MNGKKPVIVSATLAVTCLLFWLSKEKQNVPLLPVVSEKWLLNNSEFYDVPTSGRKGISGDQSKSTFLPITLTTNQLETAQGKNLSELLEAFWRDCSSKSTCDIELEQAKNHLSNERYELLSNYQQLKRKWEHELGNLLFDHLQPLNLRIEQIKDEAKNTWGAMSEIILADQFTFYDFSIQSENLKNTQSHEYISAFSDLMNTWQDDEKVLKIATPQAKYELAKSLLPDNLDKHEREALILSLQQIFLTRQERENISSRDKQVSSQQQLVEDYQFQLQQLETELSRKRATSYTDWSDEEWSIYRQQQVTSFRRRFFLN